MPRPPRPVDPSEGPVQRFAAELRKLRAEAGDPAYRDMAKKVYRSKTALADAASGHRLPTWDVTRAYVEACEGDVDEWRERWIEAGGLPRITPSRSEGGDGPATAEAATGETAREARRSTLWKPYAVALAVAVTVAGLIAVWGMAPRSSHSSNSLTVTRSPTSSLGRFINGTQPVADNADPKKSGCAYDPAVATVDKVEVNTPDEHYLGELQVRHSPLCGAAWGRFEPSEGMKALKRATVKITAVRPATSTTGEPYQTHFDGQLVFGNILLEKDGCIMIAATIESTGATGAATTDCKP
jgi:hypothetical protein